LIELEYNGSSMKFQKYKLNNKTVYEYIGCTYGCCADWETPVTDKPGKYPFLGVPTKDLIPDGSEEVEGWEKYE
jgi:hypothetical protein